MCTLRDRDKVVSLSLEKAVINKLLRYHTRGWFIRYKTNSDFLIPISLQPNNVDQIFQTINYIGLNNL